MTTIPSTPSSLTALAGAISAVGLVFRGALRLSADDRRGGFAGVATVALVGMAGRDGWGAFAASPEARDGADHPLDRFSRRIVRQLAEEFAAVALFPFDGPPYHPFQQWAMRAEPVRSSPLGLLIHPRYGLWHSYRGALGFAASLDLPPAEDAPGPCVGCPAPCLSACPVGAFTSGGYDVPACAARLRSGQGADCMAGGCLARRACPIGAAFRHGAEQSAFTMRAFLRARA